MNCVEYFVFLTTCKLIHCARVDLALILCCLADRVRAALSCLSSTCVSGTAFRYTDPFTCILSRNVLEQNIILKSLCWSGASGIARSTSLLIKPSSVWRRNHQQFLRRQDKLLGLLWRLQYPRTSIGVAGRKKRDVSSSSKWNLVQSINVQPFPTSTLFQSTEFKVLANGWPTRCFGIVSVWKSEKIQLCSKALWEMKLGLFLRFV